MNYISTTKAAQIWGITANRITILAKEGRIPGAERIGSRWMIPSDAKKPADKRFRKNQLSKTFFRFPDYVDFEAEQFTPPLSDDEITLRNVQILYQECRFEEASAVLSDLPEKSANPYIKITALFYACLLCMQNIQAEQLSNHINQLQSLLAGDFPYKSEMSFLLYELDAIIGANQYFLEEFHTDPTYSYHPSAYPFIQSLTAYSLCIRNMSAPQNTDLSIYELDCAKLENDGFYSSAQSMHIFLCLLHLAKGNRVFAVLHLKKAFKIAQARHYYYMPAMYYSYLGKLYDSVLSEFPVEFADMIKRLGKDVHDRYVLFMDIMKVNHIYSTLPRKDFQYIWLISQGLTNKEIAAKLSISESTAAKRISQICTKLNVTSKSELRELFVQYNNQAIMNRL